MGGVHDNPSHGSVWVVSIFSKGFNIAFCWEYSNFETCYSHNSLMIFPFVPGKNPRSIQSVVTSVLMLDGCPILVSYNSYNKSPQNGLKSSKISHVLILLGRGHLSITAHLVSLSALAHAYVKWRAQVWIGWKNGGYKFWVTLSLIYYHDTDHYRWVFLIIWARKNIFHDSVLSLAQRQATSWDI